MGQLDKIEMTLDDALNKKAPFKLPTESRKMLAGSMWWLALVFGVLQMWLAWDLWHLGNFAEEGFKYANDLSRASGGPGVMSSDLGMMYYLSFFVLVVDAALLLLAAPGLKAMRKAGWNLVFYSLLLNVVYGVLVMFSDVRGGFGELLWSVAGSVAGA